MKRISALPFAALALLPLHRVYAAVPSFAATSAPAGWTVAQGEAAPGEAVVSKTGAALMLKTIAAQTGPVEAILQFRATAGSTVSLQAFNDAPPPATAPPGAGTPKAAAVPPPLDFRFVMTNDWYASVYGNADGGPLQADIPSTRSWPAADKKRNAVIYMRRFMAVGNLWDENDRQEIGSANATLPLFSTRVFTARLVLTPTTRQIWLDGRFLGESKTSAPANTVFLLGITGGASVLSLDFTPPPTEGAFNPLPLTAYSQSTTVRKVAPAAEETRLLNAPKSPAVPVLAGGPAVDIDLGETLYRYRNTKGTGPNAPYVNALKVWPSAFILDPALKTFRVPYRPYQNVWLLAWKDDEAGAVARGTFRFYREEAGYPAATDFEISDDAIRRGLVTPQGRDAAGRQLYLIKVPVNTDGLYGQRDLAGGPIDFELSKPVSLTRSYPDPIYYGYHPVGPPSSLHIAGITLETAPFDYEVKPARFAGVFEQPGKPDYTVAVTNNTTKPMVAKVRFTTKSYDGTETTTALQSAKLEPGQTGDVRLGLTLKKNGWHELKANVEAGGAAREVTLSLLNLPPNTRKYGEADNETRFGAWILWGHYQPLKLNDQPANDRVLEMMHALGIRRIGLSEGFFNKAKFKELKFRPVGPHTLIRVYHTLNENDAAAVTKMVETELGQVAGHAAEFPEAIYLYGGEWGISPAMQYGQWPAYTGEGDRHLTEEEKARITRQSKIYEAIGRGMREKFPNVKLVFQWGAPKGTVGFLKTGFPKELIDAFGVDAPMFELLPELSNVPGSISDLWTVRQQAKAHGYPDLKFDWVEGPFFPTNPGALTEREQAEYQIRYWLGGLAAGIDRFEAGVVPFDGGNYYGAEHYGAGVFSRNPLLTPKPAAAAIATATAMLEGADPDGTVETGTLTTFCQAFKNTTSGAKTYALWRVEGEAEATLRVAGTTAVVTDAMGNATPLPVQNGTVRVKLGSMPVWLTGTGGVTGFTSGAPTYAAAPAAVTAPVSSFTDAAWSFTTQPDTAFETNHFAVKRVAAPNFKANFKDGEPAHLQSVGLTLEKEPGDRPLATRYGTLQAAQPQLIPGKAAALGLWVKGNAGWGRVVYQLRDAKGELWTSAGTKDDWNSDDTHGWSYVKFEGWRYVRFPLPGNHPYDLARETETTWWGSRGGDGIVDLPLRVERVFVEARNEVYYLGEMKTVPDRTIKLSSLVAEYARPEDKAFQDTPRMPVPAWTGPADNPIARLQQAGAGAAPTIDSFTEPGHFNDGRSMVIHFQQEAGKTYKLYVSRYPDGRGADLLRPSVLNDQIVPGFRPDTEMFLFLTATGADKAESKPSAPYRLVTKDNFREK